MIAPDALAPGHPEQSADIAGAGRRWEEIVAAAYETHATELRGRFRRATFDDGVADDLLHEAFARLCVQTRVGPVPDNIGGWLHRVGMNLLASDARRAGTARRNAPRIAPVNRDQSPEETAEHRELSRRMTVALAALEPADRIAILLAAGGTSRAEMAQRLGRSEEATRALLCRARSKLRVSLGAG